MAKYLCKLRRGWKEDASGRDDWAQYEAQADHMRPLAGELVIEYYNGIPRLKIGDGINEFSALPYLSVDSFILPKPASVTLLPDQWFPVLDENQRPIENRYYQPVTVQNAVVTPNSKIDLQPTPSDLAIFHEKDITFTAVNAGGNVRVCIVGQKPTKTYTMQVTITEVAIDA